MSLSEYLNGKKVLVTGAGRGIGRALCARLHKYGATVFALSQNPDNLATLKKELPGINTICVDLADWTATRIEVSKLGPIDGLINNAGIYQSEGFLKISPDNFDKTMSINVKAVLNVSQVVAQKMIDAGKGGSIVNISSIGSKTCHPGGLLYSASKAALDMVTRSMALELGPHKIRVNSLNPAGIDTDMYRNSAKGATPEVFQKYLERIPLGELVIPMDDIVNTILFLLSNMASMMTGECVVIDGGLLTN